jgi:hypothetical protein
MRIFPWKLGVPKVTPVITFWKHPDQHNMCALMVKRPPYSVERAERVPKAVVELFVRVGPKNGHGIHNSRMDRWKILTSSFIEA